MPLPKSNLIGNASEFMAAKKLPKLTLTFTDPLQPWRDSVCVVAVTSENLARIQAKQVAEDMVNAVLDMADRKDAKAAVVGMKNVTHR